MTESLSPNTQAILLLTAPLITGEGVRAKDLLTPGEYNKLARRIRELDHEPADLLAPTAGRLLDECDALIDKARLEGLLGRGFQLSQAVERWHARAIWVISRADGAYPQRLKARLREHSPALLYGCGERALLDMGGLAVVGSRHVDDELIEYTQGVGRLVAAAGRTVVSGGAKGVDQAAIWGALEAGGRALGVLADSLQRTSMARDYRKALLEGRLLLVSPYDPGARFNAGHAMQRNKVIFALADAGLVVNADLGKGGTWAGAIEQLSRLRLVPVFVRRAGAASSGLDALVDKGAEPWPEPTDAGGLNAAIEAAASQPAIVEAVEVGERQLSFDALKPSASEVREGRVPTPRAAEAIEATAPTVDTSPGEELFRAVRAAILRVAREPMAAAEVARELDVTTPQAQKWLNRMAKAGELVKSRKPVKFSVAEPIGAGPRDSTGSVARASGKRPKT